MKGEYCSEQLKIARLQANADAEVRMAAYDALGAVNKGSKDTNVLPSELSRNLSRLTSQSILPKQSRSSPM